MRMRQQTLTHTIRWLEKQCKAEALAGFEPTPLRRLEPKS